MCFANQEVAGERRMESRKVIPITNHSHFADYAELQVLREKVIAAERRRAKRRYDYIDLVLVVLAVLVVVSFFAVEHMWN